MSHLPSEPRKRGKTTIPIPSDHNHISVTKLGPQSVSTGTSDQRLNPVVKLTRVCTRKQAKLSLDVKTTNGSEIDSVNNFPDGRRLPTMLPADENEAKIVDEILPLQSMSMEVPSPISPKKNLQSVHSAPTSNMDVTDSLLGQEVIKSPYKNAGYDTNLIDAVLRLRCIIKSKRDKLDLLSKMNLEAEMKTNEALTMHPANIHRMSDEFQRRTAAILISIEKVNRDMQTQLNKLQDIRGEFICDPGIHAKLTPDYLREQCREQVDAMVEQNIQGAFQNASLLELIKGLAMILTAASYLGEGNSREVIETLGGRIVAVRSTLADCNIETFEKNVHLHFARLRLGIGHNLVANSSMENDMQY